jgi:hypothetical protein
MPTKWCRDKKIFKDYKYNHYVHTYINHPVECPRSAPVRTLELSARQLIRSDLHNVREQRARQEHFANSLKRAAHTMIARSC